MLNNLTNFFSIIRKRRLKTQLEPSDLIAVGTKQSPALGDYKPTAVKFEDLKTQIVGAVPPGVSLFTQLQDTEPYTGKSNELLVVKPTEDGLTYIESNDLMYDSGWKTIPIYNGSYGLANTGLDAYRPQVRVIGRTLFFDGWYLIPLATSLTGSILDTNGPGYVGSFLPRVYQGSGNGYELTAQNQIITRSPILPLALRPDKTWVFAHNRLINRTVHLNGRTRLHSIIQLGYVTTDGKFAFNSVQASERDGLTTSAYTKSAQIRAIVDRFNNGDDMEEFDVYRNSHSGGFATDNRVLQDTGVNWNFDFDGTLAQDLGGFFVRTEFSYTLNPAYTIDQIKTAFDAL